MLTLRLDVLGLSVRFDRWFFDFEFPTIEAGILKGLVLIASVRAGAGFLF